MFCAAAQYQLRGKHAGLEMWLLCLEIQNMKDTQQYKGVFIHYENHGVFCVVDPARYGNWRNTKCEEDRRQGCHSKLGECDLQIDGPPEHSASQSTTFQRKDLACRRRFELRPEKRQQPARPRS